MDMNLSSLMVTILILALISIAVKTVNWFWLTPRKLEKLLRKQGLRGNPYRIIHGDVRDFAAVTESELPKTISLTDELLPHILPFYHNFIKKFGQGSFVWYGPTPRLNIIDPDLIKEVLTKPGIYQKTHPDPIGESIIGGLLFLEDEKWALHRKIISTAFHMEKLKKMIPTMFISCSETIQKWQSLINSNGGKSLEVDVWPYLEDLSGDVISRTAFGSNYEQGKRIFERQKEQVQLVLKLLKSNYIPGWRYFPTKSNRRMNVITEEIRSVLRGIIDERARAKQRGEIVANDDLLGVFLEASAKEGNKNNALRIEDIIDECKFFYFAGSETTSSVLVWAMVMLSKYSDWQTRAREEVFQVFGKNDPTTFEGITQLKTVTMIINEILRMYTPAPVTTRAAKKTVKLGNMTIPVGAQVTLLWGIVHYDTKIWGKDANEFNPARFSDGVSGAANTPFSFLPFSGGPRVCIGEKFAMIEAAMALAMILKHFSFELSPSYRHAPFPIMTLQPQYGAPLILHKL